MDAWAAEPRTRAPPTVEVFGAGGRIWPRAPQIDPATGLMCRLRNLKSPGLLFRHAAFNSRGDAFATVDQRGNVYCFHVLQNRLALCKRLGSAGTALAFQPRHPHTLLAALADRSVVVLDVATNVVLATLKAHGCAVHHIAFSQAGDLCLTCGADAAVLWRTDRWERVSTLRDSKALERVEALPDSSGIVSLFADDSVGVWQLPELQKQHILVPGRTGADTGRVKLALRVCAVSSNARYLLVGGRCSRLLLFELHLRAALRTLLLPDGETATLQLAFLPNSEVAAVLCDSGRLLFVDVLSRRVLAELFDPKRAVERFAISPDGRFLVAVLGDGACHLHDLRQALLYRQAEAHATRAYGERAGEASEAFRLLRAVQGLELGEIALRERPARAEEEAEEARGGSAEEQDEQEQERAAGRSRRERAAEVEEEADADADAARGAPGPATRQREAAEAKTHEVKDEKAEEEEDEEESGTKTATAAAADGTTGEGGEARPQRGSRPASPSATLRGFAFGPQSDAPLRRLAETNPQTRLLQTRKLRAMLESFGAYPDKYRLLIWRFLLQLPENQDAFAALVAKGRHPALADLHQRYPLKDRRLFRHLETVLSALAHWSPLFAEVSFLPALAFPFARLYEHDELAAFEMTMCFLLNWCREWFRFFPNPPVHLLDGMVRLLRHHDAALVEHLEAAEVVPQTLLWALYRTLLTEVLSRDEWLQLFDHVLSSDPLFLQYAVVTYATHMRAALLSARSQEDFEFFLQHKHAVVMRKLVAAIYRLRAETPDEVALREGDAKWAAIPRGRAYPLFQSYYPSFVVDMQLQERERIRLEEEEIALQQQNLAALSQRMEELRKQQEEWHARQEELMRLEDERRRKWLEEEEARARQRVLLGKQTAARRLEQVELMEKTTVQMMADQERFRLAELQRLDDEARRGRAKQELEVQLEQQREAVEAVEFQMRQRLLQAQAERERLALRDDLQKAEDARHKQEQLEGQVRQQRWRTEDEERRAKMQAIVERKQAVARLNAEMRAKRELERKATLDLLERDAQMSELERERRLRILREAEAVRTHDAEEEKRQIEEMLAREEALAERALLAEARKAQSEQAAKRAALLEEQQKEAENEVQRRVARIQEMEREQRRREFQERLREQKEKETADALQDERDLHRVLAKLEEEKAQDRRLELELLFKEQEMKEKLAFQRVLREAEDRVVREERERYRRLREELAGRLTQEEAAMIKRHEETMTRLIVQRERQLWRLNEHWRAGVQSEELARLEREYKEHEARLRSTRAQFLARERALRDGIARGAAAAEGDALRAPAQPAQPAKPPPPPPPPRAAKRQDLDSELVAVRAALRRRGNAEEAEEEEAEERAATERRRRQEAGLEEEEEEEEEDEGEEEEEEAEEVEEEKARRGGARTGSQALEELVQRSRRALEDAQQRARRLFGLSAAAEEKQRPRQDEEEDEADVESSEHERRLGAAARARTGRRREEESEELSSEVDVSGDVQVSVRRHGDVLSPIGRGAAPTAAAAARGGARSSEEDEEFDALRRRLASRVKEAEEEKDEDEAEEAKEATAAAAAARPESSLSLVGGRTSRASDRARSPPPPRPPARLGFRPGSAADEALAAGGGNERSWTSFRGGPAARGARGEPQSAGSEELEVEDVRPEESDGGGGGAAAGRSAAAKEEEKEDDEAPLEEIAVDEFGKVASRGPLVRSASEATAAALAASASSAAAGSAGALTASASVSWLSVSDETANRTLFRSQWQARIQSRPAARAEPAAAPAPAPARQDGSPVTSPASDPTVTAATPAAGPRPAPESL